MNDQERYKMNFERDAILRIVTATRLSMNLANMLSPIAMDSETTADRIWGLLGDALFSATGDTNEHNDFFRTQTYKFLASDDMTDEEVADEFIRMAWWRNAVRQPGPILMTDAERNVLYGTPEGEWR